MRVHHLKIGCKDVNTALRKFTHGYGFNLCGTWSRHKQHTPSKHELSVDKMTAFSTSYVLTQKDMYFVLYEDKVCHADSVTDIAFEVEDVAVRTDSVRNDHGYVIEEPCFINCQNELFDRTLSSESPKKCMCNNTEGCRSFIEYAVVKSPVGNIKHTLVNLGGYAGEFLPGFSRCENNKEICLDRKDEGGGELLNGAQDKLDHIALAVKHNTVTGHMSWYKRHFQFSRFMVSASETTNGFIVHTGAENGMRLFALTEHPCIGNAVASAPQESEMHNQNVKLIFVESLTENGVDQIHQFLLAHGGEGVQHIAFHTSDVVRDVQSWKKNGVEFLKPPKQYYSEIAPYLQDLDDKMNIDAIMENGILVDMEKGKRTDDNGYLLQVFTSPVLESRTFFFELIFRDKASGFGAGNISALWRAIEAHMKESGDDTCLSVC